jgi:hypothetical protein
MARRPCRPAGARLLRAGLIIGVVCLAISMFACGWRPRGAPEPNTTLTTASMTEITPWTSTPCISGDTTQDLQAYYTPSPTDYHWLFDFKFGVDTNYDDWNASFIFQVSEAYSPYYEVASWGDADAQWIHNGYSDYGTATAEFSGSFDAYAIVTNDESSQNCFYLGVSAWYW